MRNFQRFLLWAVFLLFFLNSSQAVNFTPGNLVVYRIGDGTRSLVNTGNPVFLDEYTTSGTLVQSILVDSVDINSNKGLVASGTATSEGLLNRSANGKYLLFTGYNGIQASSLSGTTSASVNRVIGRVDFNCIINTTTALNDFTSGNNPRSAISTDGNNIWVAGGTGGIRYTTLGATTSTQLSTTVANLRDITIFENQLFISNSSSSNIRIMHVGADTSKYPGKTMVGLNSFPNNLSPYSFEFLKIGTDTLLYFADDGKDSIMKYVAVGGVWKYRGGIKASDVRGLTIAKDGTDVKIFGTTGGSYSTGGGTIYSYTDNTGTGIVSGEATSIATADSKKAFRGISWVPEPLVSPSLTAASSATVDAAFEVTFTDDATWRTGITSITFDGNTIPSGAYNTTVAGKITFDPSFASSNLTVAKTANLIIKSTGYPDATVSQTIGAGTFNASQSTISNTPALDGENKTTTITLTAKDQYGNMVKDYVFKYIVTITDGGGIDESYTVNSIAETSTTVAKSLSVTNTSGLVSFDILTPATIDANDGISVQVYLNDGTTTFGSPIIFTKSVTPTYTITTSATNGGTVTATQTVNQGSNVTLTATPQAGATFVNWREGETILGTDLTLTLNNITSNRSIVANFNISYFTLQLLHTSDMEAGVPAIKNAPNLIALIDTFRNQYINNTLLVSGGDNYIPSPFFNASSDGSIRVSAFQAPSATKWGATGTDKLREAIGRADILLMNIAGYDASAIGNHDFDAGTSAFAEAIQVQTSGSELRWMGANFPLLSANLDFSGDANLNPHFTNELKLTSDYATKPSTALNASFKKKIAPYTWTIIDGQKIGIVGVTTQIVESISSTGGVKVKGVKENNMDTLAKYVQPWIDSLVNKGVDKIVVLSHLQQIQLEKDLLGKLNHVDVIVASGSHVRMADGTDILRSGQNLVERYPYKANNKSGKPALIVSTDGEWQYLGRLVVKFDINGDVVYNQLDSTINGAYAADSATVAAKYGVYNNAFSTGRLGAIARQVTEPIRGLIVSQDGNIIGKTVVYLEGDRGKVRKEESNLGNLSADANLWYGKLIDPTVKVSIKNGGGIRSSIGQIRVMGTSAPEYLPPVANPEAGKQNGDISQLDILNSLRFNNGLTILSVSANQLLKTVNHAVAATTETTTPGQFPQVAGIRFSFDMSKPAGQRVRNLVIVDSTGKTIDVIANNYKVYGDTGRMIRMITLDFLSTGGDSYPFKQFVAENPTRANKFDIKSKADSIKLDAVAFAAKGSEQDAFAEYMKNFYSVTPYNVVETPVQGDFRIVNLSKRSDNILSTIISIKEARKKAIGDTVSVTGIVTNGSELGSIRYLQDDSAGIAAYGSTLSGVKKGDSIIVTGKLKLYNNLLELDPVISFIVLKSNNTLPAPQVITIKQVSDVYEGKLVRFDSVTIVKAGQLTTSSAANYTFVYGKDTLEFRSTSSAIRSYKLSSGKLSITGILSQYHTSDANKGYQLLPRDTNDFKVIPNILVSSVTIASAGNVTSLRVGQTLKFTETVAPANANNKKVNWTVSDNTKASIDATGLLTASATGAVTVTATTADGSAKSASFNLTIIDANTNIQKRLNNIVVEPNPFVDQFEINSSNDSQLTYVVNDIIGNEISTGRFVGTAVINLQGKPSGFYFVRISNGKNVVIHRMIKQ